MDIQKILFIPSGKFFSKNDNNKETEEFSLWIWKFMFTRILSGIERQCKIHPSISSLIVAFQQIYLMPNGGEVSAETSDKTWILTKSDNKK